MDTTRPRDLRAIQLEKSPNDKNEYHLFELENGVRCLIINELNSAKKSSKEDASGFMASVSITVGVGCFNDPIHRQGLAHFLEHMIFMGSEKYPEEAGFSELISQNGGYTNAYTENEFTNYQFKINFDKLAVALDMQANLLAKPLLAPGAQQREIKAVNSEFEGLFSYDQIRSELILNESIPESHPLRKFGYGNTKTLTNGEADLGESSKLWSDLKAFFEGEYSADRTNVVISANIPESSSVAEIEKWVTESFGIIPNKHLGIQDFGSPALLEKAGLSEQIYFNPFLPTVDRMAVFNSVRDQNAVSFVFNFPPSNSRFWNRSLTLIDDLIQHEGEGGLYSVLKKKQWIEKICSSTHQSYNNVLTQYYVELRLLDEGIAHLEEASALLFSFIAFLAEQLEKVGEDFSFIQEQKAISGMSYKYYKVPDPLENVQQLADEMAIIASHPARFTKLLKDTYTETVIEEMSVPEIVSLLKELTFANAKVIVSGKNLLEHPWTKRQAALSEVKKEKHMKTKYQEFEKPSIPEVQQQFTLPRKNPYMPSDFSLLSVSQDDAAKNSHPTRIATNSIETFVVQDVVYKQPRAICHLMFYVPGLIKSSLDRACFSVLIDTIIERTSAKIGYEATLADTSFAMKLLDNTAVKFKFKGYNHRLAEFVLHFFEMFKDVANNGVKEEYLIDNAIEKRHKEYLNLNVEVDGHTNNNRLLLLLEGNFHSDHIAKTIDENRIKIKELLMGPFLKVKLFGPLIYTRMLITGNVNIKQAEDLAVGITKTLELNPMDASAFDKVTSGINRLEAGSTIYWDSLHASSSKDEDGSDGEEKDPSVHPSHGQSDEEMGEDEQEEKDQESMKDEEEEDEEGDDNNSCVSIYFQDNRMTTQSTLALRVIQALLEDEIFDQLRTKETLGYYVACSQRFSRGIGGLLFTVESSDFSPEHCEARIMSFIREYYEKKMSEELYKKYLTGLIVSNSEPLKDMIEETRYLTSELKSHYVKGDDRTPIWNRRETEVNFYKSEMTYDLAKQTFEEVLLNAETKRVAIFRTFSQKYAEMAQHLELDEQFKAEGQPTKGFLQMHLPVSK